MTYAANVAAAGTYKMNMGGTVASPSAGSILQVMKEVYEGQKVQELYFKEWPLLAMLKTNERLGGRGYPVPFIASPAVGANATFADAQYNSKPGKAGEFLITTSDLFGIGYLDAKTIAAAKNDKQTFVNALTFNMNGAIEGCTKALALSIYRRSYGVIGTISSISTGVVTLTNASDCLNFEVGQYVVASSSSDGTSILSRTTSAGAVLNVDRVAGTVTFDEVGGTEGTAATPGTTGGTPWSSTYCYLYTDGSQALCQSGLLDWFPATSPTSSDSFFGVNRYGYVRQRVAGTYYDGSKRPIFEAISNGCALIREQGGHPTHVFMTPVSLQGLLNELAQKGSIEWGSTKASDIDVSFEGVKIRYAGGSVICVADPACPSATAFPLDMESMFLGSIGPSVGVFDLDGVPFLRSYNANQIELRCNSYAQIYTDKPNSHGTIALQF